MSHVSKEIHTTYAAAPFVLIFVIIILNLLYSIDCDNYKMLFIDDDRTIINSKIIL